MSKIQFPLFVIVDNEVNQPLAILSDKREANAIVLSMNEFAIEDGYGHRYESYVEVISDEEELMSLVEGWNSSLKKELISEGIVYINLDVEEEG